MLRIRGALLALPVLFGILMAVYPERRVCGWFEFLTDGWMPDGFAHLAHTALSNLWTRVFELGLLRESTPLAEALASYLHSTSCTSVIELAAGAGLAPALWVHQARQQPGLHETSLLLTDIQPNPSVWQELRHTYGPFVRFADFPVDATDLAGSLNNASVYKPCQGELRMIHLALHHFDDELVQNLLRDIVRMDSALLVSDLAPNLGGLLFNGLLVNHPAVAPGPWSEQFNILMGKLPTWSWALLPVMPLIGIHDATVSVLRSRSTAQLQELLERVPGGEHYKVQGFKTEQSYGKLLGLPPAMQYGPLNDPMLQYMLITPR